MLKPLVKWWNEELPPFEEGVSAPEWYDILLEKNQESHEFYDKVERKEALDERMSEKNKERRRYSRMIQSLEHPVFENLPIDRPQINNQQLEDAAIGHARRGGVRHEELPILKQLEWEGDSYTHDFLTKMINVRFPYFDGTQANVSM